MSKSLNSQENRQLDDVDVSRIKIPIVAVLTLCCCLVFYTIVAYTGVSAMIKASLATHTAHPHAGTLTPKDAEILIGKIESLQRDIERLEKVFEKKF